MQKYRIDLHVHIDGSVSPLTVYEIARREHIEPECHKTLEEIASSMIMPEDEPDPEFLKFEPPIRAMQSKYAIERVTWELIRKLDSQDVIYSEPRFAPQLHTKRGLTQREVVKAAISGLKKGLKECSTMVDSQLLLCCMDFTDASINSKENLETVEIAGEYLGKGVCGIDLAGAEDNLKDFYPLFKRAKELGIPTTVHTNRTSADALSFKTERIGHGYATAKSEDLVEEAVANGTVYEICPQSSRSYNSIMPDTNHPLVHLYRSGVKVAVCTDNLTVLSTDMDHEFFLVEKMGLTEEDIHRMSLFAAEGAFVTEEMREKLIRLLEEE